MTVNMGIQYWRLNIMIDFNLGCSLRDVSSLVSDLIRCSTDCIHSESEPEKLQEKANVRETHSHRRKNTVCSHNCSRDLMLHANVGCDEAQICHILAAWTLGSSKSPCGVLPHDLATLPKCVKERRTNDMPSSDLARREPRNTPGVTRPRIPPGKNSDTCSG